MLEGFSFDNIRDYAVQGALARTEHLAGVLTFLEVTTPPVVGARGMPDESVLERSYPNPANPTATIAFRVAHSGNVTLKIYSVSGQLVKTLIDGPTVPGVRQVIAWDGRNNDGEGVSSGVYFYELVAPKYRKARKLVLLK